MSLQMRQTVFGWVFRSDLNTTGGLSADSQDSLTGVTISVVDVSTFL